MFGWKKNSWASIRDAEIQKHMKMKNQHRHMELFYVKCANVGWPFVYKWELYSQQHNDEQ